MIATEARRLSPLEFSGKLVSPAPDNAFVYLTMAVTGAGTVLGFVLFFWNGADPVAVPYLGALSVISALAVLQTQMRTGRLDRELIVLSGASLGAAALVWTIPEFIFGMQFNAIVHRTLFSSFLVLLVSVVGLSSALFNVLGSRPSARDMSRYPLIVIPVVAVFLVYVILLARMFMEGADTLTWQAVTTPYERKLEGSGLLITSGFRNHILGTLLLTGLTLSISIPAGVAAGIYISEYRGLISNVVNFSTTMLRAVSPFLLALTAFGVVNWADPAYGTPLSDFVNGKFMTVNGPRVGGGSYMLAAIFMSMLVIPVITRATEEGLGSAPVSMREGSQALGADDAYMFRRLLVPWALPNIVTGVLLGATEAAGSVAVILLLAGTGENGVGVFNQVTSLSHFIYHLEIGDDLLFVKANQGLEFSAGILLTFFTLTLSISALVLKQQFMAKFRR